MFNLHLLFPVIVTIRFIFFEREKELILSLLIHYWVQFLFWYMILLYYFLIIIKIFNKKNKKIPYPFLNIYGNPWWYTIIYLIISF